MAGPFSAVPPHVLARLGAAPEELTRLGSSVVLRGNGLVLKTGPPDRAAREAFVLTEVDHLPTRAPSLIDAGAGWLLLEEIAIVDPSDVVDTTCRDSALIDLAQMHDALAGDPILTDHRLRDVCGRELPALRERSIELATDLDLPAPLRVLSASPERLLTTISGATTLVHGDAWPGNVLPIADGGHCWIDWEEAGRGHPALDLANWLYGSPWVPEAQDPDRDLATYLAARTNTIDAVQFREAISAAAILLFLLLDLPGLATWERAARRQIIDQRAATAHTLVG